MGLVLEYKGFYAGVLYSDEDCVFYGKVSGINDLVNFENDLVNFESDSEDHIEYEFHRAVDEYLDLCKEIEKDYK